MTEATSTPKVMDEKQIKRVEALIDGLQKMDDQIQPALNFNEQSRDYVDELIYSVHGRIRSVTEKLSDYLSELLQQTD